MLIPGIEIDFYAWHENRAALTASGVEILLNNPSLIDLCKDKWAFYQKLVQLAPDLAIASSLEADFDQLKSRFGLPLLLKPRRGFGSKGVVRVHDEAGFIGFSTEIGRTLMVQPVVGTDDEEYTVAAFGDGKGGYRAAMAMRRTLSSDGFTGTAEVVGLAPFEDALRRLSSHFLPVGPCNFQFRKTSADLKLLEINPRISSSTSIRTAFGYNESAMAVEFLLSGDLPVQPVIRGGRAVRYTEDQLFYEDGIHF
jgi:carbamoyl-phosphate synthase large subunit